MGSTLADIDAAVAYWTPRLLDPSYTAHDFRDWLMKEFPQHPVTLAPFAIGRFPVTNAEYRAYGAAVDVAPPESIRLGEPGTHPVWGVTAAEAARYCAWLGARMEMSVRLPSEAEWEFAARGPTGREFPFGDAFDSDRCNTAEAAIGHTTPVDSYLDHASGFGVVDLAGNVEEWTGDTYAPYPGGEPVSDHLTALVGAQYPVLRGGSFARGGDLARCARRHGPHPGPEHRYRGFRIASAPQPRHGGSA